MEKSFYAVMMEEGWQAATQRFPLPDDGFWERATFSILINTIARIPNEGATNSHLRKHLKKLVFPEAQTLHQKIALYDICASETEHRTLLMEEVVHMARDFEEWLLIYFRADEGSDLEKKAVEKLQTLEVSKARLKELLGDLTHRTKELSWKSDEHDLHRDEEGGDGEQEEEKGFVPPAMSSPLYFIILKRLGRNPPKAKRIQSKLPH